MGSRLLVFCLAATLIVGCSSNTPPLAVVTGRITVGGEALKNARIVFSPEGGKRKVQDVLHGGDSFDETNSSGEFRLVHHSGSSGAELGKHRVIVQVPGVEIDDVPEGLSATEIRALIQPQPVSLGDWSTIEVIEGTNRIEITLPVGAVKISHSEIVKEKLPSSKKKKK